MPMGIHVGDAPQTQFAPGWSLDTLPGLENQPGAGHITLVTMPISNRKNRTNPDDSSDSWKLDSYAIMDLHVSYEWNWKKVPFQWQLHVFNLFDEEFINEADDGSGHDALTAEVLYGFGTTFNTSLGVKF